MLEVARNAYNPIGTVTRELRNHFGERDHRRTLDTCDLAALLLALSALLNSLSCYS